MDVKVMNAIDPDFKERAYELARKINSRYCTANTDVTVNEVAMAIMDFSDAETAALTRWKREQLTVANWWFEIDAFVRNHPHAVIGHKVSETALEWLRQRDTQCGVITRLRREIDELQAKVEDLS